MSGPVFSVRVRPSRYRDAAVIDHERGALGAANISIRTINIGPERRPWKLPVSRRKQILTSNFTGDQFGGVRTRGYALLRDEGEEK